MTTLVDHNLTLYKYLVSCSTLMTTVSNRLYGPPLGIPVGMTQPQAAIVFACDSGAGEHYIPMATLRFIFYVYGATPAGAQAVFRDLFDALHRKGRTDITVATNVKHLLSYAALENRTDLPEPELGWPRIVCWFQVRLGERVEAW